MRKKREFHSSELVKSLAKIYGFDVLSLKIKSPLLKNDFQMRKSFYINKISSELGIEITQIIIL